MSEFCIATILALFSISAAAEPVEPAWTKAQSAPPMTAAETRQFMSELARFVADNHMKQDSASPQRGMVYEYFHVARKGEFDQFVQGEALDTMHDGAWLAAALATAYRATGEQQYQDLLAKWELPFYLKMLNHSDSLFAMDRNDARPGGPTWGKEHALQKGERGFVPYFWDDGGSVSLDQLRDKKPQPVYPAVNFLAGKPNPHFLLDGYALGSSNHLAQDLGVMLQVAWLLFKDLPGDENRQLAAELAEGARNLQACRMRHHGHIPMCDAPLGLITADAALLRSVPDGESSKLWTPTNNVYYQSLYAFKPGQRYTMPAFGDNQEYIYYAGIARHGTLPQPLAFQLIYDACTLPELYRLYSDDAAVPAGINRFDLYPYFVRDGKPEDYRSDRQGPRGGPKPIGSRMGPQMMVVCGWALQALRQYPGIWEYSYRTNHAQDLRVYISDETGNSASSSTPWAEWEAGGLSIKLASSQQALKLSIDAGNQPTSVKVFARPDANGAFAMLSLDPAQGVKGLNDQVQPLRFNRSDVKRAGGSTHYEIELPYTLNKGQSAWANGIEQGRYSIQVGNQVRNLFLASSEAAVQRRLEHELAGGLRTWEAIFKQYGYIPSGIGTGSNGAGLPWDQFSDTGGYAHLIAAASEWLLYLEHKNDWDLHHLPKIPAK